MAAVPPDKGTSASGRSRSANLRSTIYQGKDGRKRWNELGDIIDDLFARKESKRQTGAIGLLTDNVVTRTDAFADLVAMACAPFLHPELY